MFALTRSSVVAGAVLAVVLLGSGCSASPSTQASGTASATHSASSQASPTPVPSPTAFKAPQASCPLVSIKEIEQISGVSDVTSQELNTAGNTDLDLIGCEYSSGGKVVGDVTVTIDTATSGESAQQYLSDDIAQSQFNYGLSQNVTGLADAAKFGTATGSAGLIGSLWFIQLRGDQVADVSVGCLDPKGAEAPILAMARTVLSQL